MTKAGRDVVVGNWRITEMEVWDADYFDMEVPAYLTIRKDLTLILGERWNESRPTILISNMTVKAAKLYLSPKVWDRVAGTSHHSLLIELWLNSFRNPYA